MPLKNVFVEANVENNNALVKKISLTHEIANSLEILDFFDDLDSHGKSSN